MSQTKKKTRNPKRPTPVSGRGRQRRPMGPRRKPTPNTRSQIPRSGPFRAQRLTTVEGSEPSAYGGNPGAYNTLVAKKDFNASWKRYIQAIVEPEAVTKASMVNQMVLSDVRIPDLSLFPCSVAQTKTVGSISPDNTGGFILWAYPFMHNGFNIFNTTGASVKQSVMVGDIVYTQSNATFDIYGITSWEDSIQAYRPISMSVKMWYVGQLLGQSGKLCSACLPPFSQSINTFSELSSVPYSFQTKMTDGIRQIWFPIDYRSAEFQVPTEELGFDQVPSITIIGNGINGFDATDPQFTIQFEIVVNFEIYSISQLFNNKVHASSVHPLSAPIASHTASKVVAKNGGGSTSKTSDIMSFIKDAVSVAETAAPIIGSLISLI